MINPVDTRPAEVRVMARHVNVARHRRRSDQSNKQRTTDDRPTDRHAINGRAGLSNTTSHETRGFARIYVSDYEEKSALSKIEERESETRRSSFSSSVHYLLP